MRAITADYQERIIIGPEDVIPKSSWFRFVKCSLVAALSMLVTLAVITLIVAESFVNNNKAGLATGIVSLVGIILFLIGMIAIIKEHIPLVLSFSVAMILYLLLFMYSRVITSPGLIILRTCILLLLAIESFCFCIMIRDWRALQIGRLNQRLLKEAQYQAAVSGGGLMMHSVNSFAGYPAGSVSQQHQQMYAYSASGGQLMGSSSSRQMYQQQQHRSNSGYPDEMRPYQTPILGRSGPYGSPLSPSQQQQQQLLGRGGHQQMSGSGMYNQQQQQQPYSRHGPHQQYDQQDPTTYQQQQQHQQNPYITIEDENPYAQIGEPTVASNSRRGQLNQGHLYTTSRQASQPRRY